MVGRDEGQRGRRPLEAELGDIVLKEQWGGPGHRRGARGVGRPHICFLLQGSFTERRTGRCVTRRAGEVRVSPADDAHDVEFGDEGARCLMISAPERIRSPDGPRFARSPALDALGRDLRRELLDFRGDAADPLPSLVVEAAAYECFDLLGVDDDQDRSPGPWLRRVREFLRDRPGRVPSLSEVAAVADRHPTHVARTFREAYGCTVGHYARRLRLRRTVRLILEGRESLSGIAHAMGFSDQSHMTRAVRRVLGRTPGDLRGGTRASQ